MFGILYMYMAHFVTVTFSLSELTLPFHKYWKSSLQARIGDEMPCRQHFIAISTSL